MKIRYLELPTRKANRLKAKIPKGGLFWCGCCDAAKVGDGSKCPVCGHKIRKFVLHKGELP